MPTAGQYSLTNLVDAEVDTDEESASKPTDYPEADRNGYAILQRHRLDLCIAKFSCGAMHCSQVVEVSAVRQGLQNVENECCEGTRDKRSPDQFKVLQFARL